ncbi:hypothetical protein HMI54_014676 [Coelomomyces lativittatus]|nr:hypothetical protein HMI56_002217 [Coelomomyces lativittatus]KAJ1509216.1 hypothetical protein HMI55_000060 [Coelomomyces lativittatus]KAJ1513796.1 hypothetical protein HMI54_014676 [Coelomomyces lativittatus]
MEHAHTKSPEELLHHFSVDPKKGLTHVQVQQYLQRFGKNELPEEPSTPLWKLILEQFQDHLVVILLIAAVISFILAILELKQSPLSGSEADGDLITAFVEPIVILLILIANATVGVIQESNAEKAIEALKDYSPDEAKVLRGGTLTRIHAKDIVPGDIIDVAIGDKIPADGRLISISSASLKVDQAILTGESVSVFKDLRTVPDLKAVKQDMVNSLFAGTTVTIGKARAIVTATGKHTAIGNIHQAIASSVTERTPLKKKLDEFGDMLAKMITVVCVLVWVINIKHFNDPLHHGWLKGAIYYFKIAVALAVAAIPEGLAVVITTCLALGTKRMAKKNAIVRTLPSVETLGCTTVICSDKTGTLTTNQMSVCELILLKSASPWTPAVYSVEGISFSPLGLVHHQNEKVPSYSLPSAYPAIVDLTTISSLCNDASIKYELNGSFQEFMAVGEPTEAALKVLVEKLGTPNIEFNESLNYLPMEQRAMAVNEFYMARFNRLKTFDFSRDRKSMSVMVQSIDSSDLKLLVKGAPESILDRCTQFKLLDGTLVPMDEKVRKQLLEQVETLGQGRALRVLAFGYTTELHPQWQFINENKDFIEIERNLIFVGFAAMMDPPRAQVRDALEKCENAGIRVVVITGDNKHTAEAICRNLGLIRPSEKSNGISYTGREFESMDSYSRAQAVKRAKLFSRVEPSHKQDLVELLQLQGQIVAMTGDGVNDAPALKKADIGVSMGSGTDVAKLASDMVLADDDFSSIVLAVEEGRSIYNNTKQFIRYLISSNIGEVVAIFLTVLLGMPEALIPVQLLWVNLITDGLPATALGFNPTDPEIMLRPPRRSTEPIVTKWLFFRYLVIGTYVGVATVFGYAWWFMYYSGGPLISWEQLTNHSKCSSLYPSLDCQKLFTGTFPKKGTTMSLSILVMIEMLNAMNSVSENASLLTMPFWRNGYLVVAIILSFLLHLLILYVPFFSTLFNIVPLNFQEWIAVTVISLPVIFIDEILKFFSRILLTEYTSPPSKGRLESEMEMLLGTHSPLRKKSTKRE